MEKKMTVFRPRPQLALPDISEIVLNDEQLTAIKQNIERSERFEARQFALGPDSNQSSLPQASQKIIIAGLLRLLDSEGFRQDPRLQRVISYIQSQKNAPFVAEEALNVAESARTAAKGEGKDEEGYQNANFRITLNHSFCDGLIKQVITSAGIPLSRSVA